VWYYKNGHLTVLDVLIGKNLLRELSVDSQNRLWIMLDHALLVYDGHSFRRITAAKNYLGAWAIGPDDRIWMGGGGMMTVYDPTKDKQP
jgi:hypothetical protein